jgi:hypothetical protein
VDPTKPRGLFHEYLIWALVRGVGRELHMLVIGTWGKMGIWGGLEASFIESVTITCALGLMDRYIHWGLWTDA